MKANVVQQQQQQSINNIKGMEAELYRAAIRGSFEGISLIPNWKEQRTPTKNNILHLHVGKALLQKAKVCSVFIEKVIHDLEGYMLLWKENDYGDTPIHLAARFGHNNAVKAFLDRATQENQEDVTSLLKVANKKMDTALHEAARVGHAKVVKLLVEADPNCPYHHEPNCQGETPFYLAAERGCTSSVLSILETCNVFDLTHKGPCGRTALHAAVQWGEPEMVSRMLEKDKSLMKIQDDEGLTPLHCVASEIGKLHLLEILLCYDEQEKETSTVYIPDKWGRTALHIAMLRGNWKAIDDLIESCPDCIEIVDKNGQNVLHYAAKWTCYKVINGLLEKDHLNKLINDKDNDGNTPLHVLAASIPKTPDMHFCADSLLPINKNPFLDVKAFNKDNLTCGDILASLYGLLRSQHKLKNIKFWRLPRGKRMKTYEKDAEYAKAATGAMFGEWNVVSIKKVAESRLVVAALIATVSFAAGFTLPGGLDQNRGQNMGMAVLKNTTSFKAFLISDMIAFTSSTLAIICYFVLASTEIKQTIKNLSFGAYILNTMSVGALMIAFVAGVSAVLSHSNDLVIAICVIAATFFCGYFGLFYRLYHAAAVWGGRFHYLNGEVLR